MDGICRVRGGEGGARGEKDALPQRQIKVIPSVVFQDSQSMGSGSKPSPSSNRPSYMSRAAAILSGFVPVMD